MNLPFFKKFNFEEPMIKKESIVVDTSVKVGETIATQYMEFAYCDCGRGIYKYDGTHELIREENTLYWFKHTCDNCGKEVYLSDIYPKAKTKASPNFDNPNIIKEIDILPEGEEDKE